MNLQRKLIKLSNSLKLARRTYLPDCSNSKNEEIEEETNIKKSKVTSTEKVFRKDSGSPVILEVKRASTVIKKLNWEFKMLYGDVQAPKRVKAPKRESCKKENENFKTIIQNQTVLPILDPEDDLNLVQSTYLDACNDPNKVNLSKILKFPLLNHESTVLKSNLTVTEINSLRKVLEEKSKTYVPSVSRILEKTMPQQQAEILRRWKENMIKQLGEEGFKKYQQELLSRGHAFHTCINSYLASEPRSEIEIEESIAGHWESVKAIFPSIRDVKLLEERLTHPFLQYKGIVDCFARYKDNLVVIDWKSSKKRKLTLSSTYDNPLQIAAYVGALNFDPKYQYLVNKGLIVVAYEDGSQATAHFMDPNVMHRYWKEWLNRVKLYWELIDREESYTS